MIDYALELAIGCLLRVAAMDVAGLEEVESGEWMCARGTE